jgi:alpha-L-rhamnosidase
MTRYTIAVLLFTVGTLQAQSPTTTEDWQAQWVWLPDAADKEMMLARKAFSLPELPRRALLSITAGTRYQLFLNGNYVGMGPARCAPHHQSYDVLDVTEALAAGENVLAARVHFQREGVSYYEPARAGLLAQLQCSWDDQRLTIPTDASWRVAPDASWQNDPPPMARFHLEVCDRVDLRQRLGGWKDVDFDDSTWTQARVL